MKITAIIGSPRKKGNSVKLAEAILDSVSKSAVKSSFLYLGEKTIKPCIGCYSCEKTRKCVIQNDDMREMYPEMEKTDVFIFASPVYFDQVSGLFKIFLDRLFPFYWEKPLANKKAVFLLNYEDSRSELYSEIVDWFTSMMESCHGLEFVDTLKIHNANKVSFSENVEVISRTIEIGQKISLIYS